MPRKKQQVRHDRAPQDDELPNGYRLFQIAEGGAYMVQVRRELLANEIAESLLSQGVTGICFQEVRPLRKECVFSAPTFCVSVQCHLEQMQHAIRHALFECIELDAALVRLGLWQFAG